MTFDENLLSFFFYKEHENNFKIISEFFDQPASLLKVNK